MSRNLSRLWMLVRIVVWMLLGSPGNPPTSGDLRAFVRRYHPSVRKPE